jgi:hypothetical protein
MKKFLALTVALFVPVVAFGMPCLYLDFDEDGVADCDTIIDRVDLGFFEPADLYVGVVWPELCEMGAAEYAINYEGQVAPTTAAYPEPGAPTWALTIGELLNGGWFQSGPCRDACCEFIARLGVTGTGAAQHFDFALTYAPYDFPGLFYVYNCVPEPVDAGAKNNAACNADPRPVIAELECITTAAEPTTWGSVKSMFN